MKSNKLLVSLAILAVVFSLANFMIVFMKVGELRRMTGFATSYGQVNLTVATEANINISRDSINWGSGVFNDTVNQKNATLYTGQETSVVEGGNWSAPAVVGGVIIQNLGNINVSLDVAATKNATDFYGSGGSDPGGVPLYQYNFTAKDAGACNGGTGIPLGSYGDVNSSTNNICAQMGSLSIPPNTYQVYMDLYLAVPADTNNTGTGNEITDTFTFTGTAS